MMSIIVSIPNVRTVDLISNSVINKLLTGKSFYIIKP
jgi:hypothetical protein